MSHPCALCARCPGDDDVILFDQPDDIDRRIRQEPVVDDVGVELGLAAEVKRARYIPVDVVGEAGENQRAIGAPETLEVSSDTPSRGLDA
jgi:hypothetical protein